MSESRLVVIMSDIEMGAGGPFDDFPYTDWLAEVLLDYANHHDGAIDLVFNGDTFDLLKTSVRGTYPNRITSIVAHEKLDRVMRAHPAFFAALRTFLADERGPRSVHFLLGNHDMELAFPSIQEAIRVAIGPANFPGFFLEIGEVHIEHGMQADSMFAVDPDHLFVRHQGERVLALPWGAVALIDVALPLQHRLWDVDRLRPRERVLELMPEVRDLLLNSYWQYWTGGWWKRLWAGNDPSKAVSWTLLREVAYRFGTQDTEAYVGDRYRKLLREREDLKICVIGHLHQPQLWSELDQRVITAGCLRDEYTVDSSGRVDRRLPKSWTEVRMVGTRVVSAELIEHPGPPMRPHQVPRHVDEVCARLRSELPDTTKHQDEQVAREAAAKAAGVDSPGPPS